MKIRKAEHITDDVTLFLEVDNPQTAADEIDADLLNMQIWAKKWLVTFNPTKTKTMLISRKILAQNHPNPKFRNSAIDSVQEHKHLGLIIRNDLTWNSHINTVVEKSTKLVNIMRSVQHRLQRSTLETIYTSFIRPILEYGDIVWSNCTQTEEQLLESVQLDAARVVTGAMKGTSNTQLYIETGWESLHQRREKRKLVQLYKIINDQAPQYLKDSLPQVVRNRTSYNFRNQHNLTPFRTRTSSHNNSFFPYTTRLWNQLPLKIRKAEHITDFKFLLDKHYKVVPKNKLYLIGNRRIASIHARFRMGSIQLNDYLNRIGVRETGACSCGEPKEDTFHYFFVCPNYNNIRINLHEMVIRLASFTLKTVLFGSDDCTFKNNVKIFEAVHAYIEQSQRFEPP